MLKIRGNDALLEEARQDAEGGIVEVARENGIVEQVQDNAKDSIRAFVQSLGHEEVVFV